MHFFEACTAFYASLPTLPACAKTSSKMRGNGTFCKQFYMNKGAVFLIKHRQQTHVSFHWLGIKIIAWVCFVAADRQ